MPEGRAKAKASFDRYQMRARGCQGTWLPVAQRERVAFNAFLCSEKPLQFHSPFATPSLLLKPTVQLC